MRYPDCVRRRIYELASGSTDGEIARIMQEEFQEYEWTRTKVKSCRTNWGLPRCQRRAKQERTNPGKFPEGMLEFVKSVAAGRTSEEITSLINESFGEGTITVAQLRAYKKSHHITSGIDCRFKKGQRMKNEWTRKMLPEWGKNSRFKKGHRPHNADQVGTLVTRTDGYLYRKTAEPNVWEFEHRLVYERENGPIPETGMVIFLDGDIGNVSPENLFLISREEHIEMIRRGYRTNETDLTRSGAILARLTVSISAREKGGYAE